MIRLSLLATATLLAMGISSSADAAGRPDLVRKDLQSGKPFAVGQMIIQFRSFATAADKARVEKVLNARRVQVLGTKGGRMNRRGDIELFQLGQDAAMQTKLDLLSNDPAVDFAEPNWYVRHTATSNDPYFTSGGL